MLTSEPLTVEKWLTSQIKAVMKFNLEKVRELPIFTDINIFGGRKIVHDTIIQYFEVII